MRPIFFLSQAIRGETHTPHLSPKPLNQAEEPAAPKAKPSKGKTKEKKVEAPKKEKSKKKKSKKKKSKKKKL